jgi:hypothetical protein
MRKSVLWKHIHVRLSLAVCIALAASLAFAGCGGGGGSSSNNNGSGSGSGNNGSGSGTGGGTPNSSLAVVSGIVQDTNGSPVLGATVSIVGTTPALAASTGSDGKFQINNVPLNAAFFQVTSPTLTKYYNSGTYNGNRYSFGTDSQACTVPLPTLTAGADPLPAPIVLDIGGTNPPPPPALNPPVGCPGHH